MKELKRQIHGYLSARAYQDCKVQDTYELTDADYEEVIRIVDFAREESRPIVEATN